MLDAFTEHCEQHGDCDRLHMERFQPKLGLGEGGEGEGGTIKFCKSDCETESDGSMPILVAGEEAGLDLPYGCREGICHTCVGELRSGRVRDLRNGKVYGAGGRGDPDVHQRARGTDRNRPVTTTRPRGERNMATVTQDGHRSNGSVTVDDEPENPLHRLTPEQIEEIGREFDELHEQVKADLGDRDARYIRSIIGLQRRLALLGRAELIASRWRIPWIVGASTLGLAKILENMEIGHNVLHGQWDWMNDPVINSRAWDWDTASTAEAWRHSHNFIHHTYTNILGKDRDLGYEIMRIDPSQKWHPVYLRAAVLQHPVGVPVRVGRRRPRPRPRGDPQGREEQGGAAQGAQGDRRQGPHPDRQGLHRVAVHQRARDDAHRRRRDRRQGALESPAKRAAKRTAAKVAWRHGGPRARKAIAQAAGRAPLVPRAVRPHAAGQRRSPT